MLDTTELLDSIVATVVIGQDQALGGDHLARTASIEVYDGVLERCAVGVVEIVLLHGQATLDELRVLLGELLQEPHPFVSSC